MFGTLLGRLLLFAVATAVALIFAPKPEEFKQSTADDIDLPRAKEGDEIIIWHGSGWVSSPQTAAWGHFKSKKIKQGGKGGKK